MVRVFFNFQGNENDIVIRAKCLTFYPGYFCLSPAVELELNSEVSEGLALHYYVCKNRKRQTHTHTRSAVFQHTKHKALHSLCPVAWISRMPKLAFAVLVPQDWPPVLLEHCVPIIQSNKQNVAIIVLSQQE